MLSFRFSGESENGKNLYFLARVTWLVGFVVWDPMPAGDLSGGGWVPAQRSVQSDRLLPKVSRAHLDPMVSHCSLAVLHRGARFAHLLDCRQSLLRELGFPSMRAGGC